MTEQEFIEKWRLHMAGAMLYGVVGNATEGPLQRAAAAHRIPGEAERFLRMMWKDLQAKPEPANGKPAQPQGATHGKK